jgi:hypothetical protein
MEVLTKNDIKHLLTHPKCGINYHFFIYFVFVSLQARMSNDSCKLFWVRGYFEPKTVSKFRLEPKLEV